MDENVRSLPPLPDQPPRCDALQAALDLIDQGIILVDKELKLVVWNRCFLQLFDFPPEMAYPGAPFENFIRHNALRGEYGPGDPGMQTEVRVAMARSFEEYDLERTRPNGTILSVRGLAVPGRGLITFYSDVTEARHREALIREQNALLEARVAERTAELLRTNAHLRQALERNEAIALSLVRSEARMRLITDSIPALLAYFGHDRRYHYVNRGYRDWFGLDPSKPESIKARSFLGEDTYSRIRPYVMQAVRGAAVTFEYEVQTVHRGLRIARTSLIPETSPEGEVVGCFELTFDVTDERLAHDRMAQAQKMEALGLLTGGLAHDFNNILTVVQGNLVALAEIPALRPYLSDYLKPALNAALRGSDLIRGLLSFARKHPLSSRVEDLNLCLASTATLLRGVLPEGLSLVTESSALPLFVCLDPNQLQDALLNLALNARDATGGKGRITIRCSMAALGSEAAAKLDLAPGQYARISVEDDGCGMDQLTMDRVFEPFFSTKAPGQGSGMGMAMVYGFVQQSAGAIELRSQVEQGTTVSIFFPLHGIGGSSADLADEPALATEIPSEGRRGLALLVEDDPGVRQLLRRELLDIGFSVIEAENGSEAIDLIDHTRDIQLLLSDVVMPGSIDGLNVVAHARSKGTIPRIVLMSAFVPNGAAPAEVPFLQKPFSRAELLKTLATARP
ncbi:PAS-domain containing protein [Malikia sp.]|uniref:PAS-domain containing protein n=1 Tax=Malikia sp. TaxID=2070706 RepID=UPI00262D787C|nr:PAS-domain containing protein [Malikia sp.]MDD2730188.1 PAS-domain containing protein [Malikia sp.]